MGFFMRALLLSSILFCIGFVRLHADDYYPGDHWRTSTPEAQGMDSDVLYRLIDAIRSHYLQIDSFLVIRHGYLVDEAYFYPYHKEDIHQLWSCTKSFTSALVGIALDKGLLKNINQKALDLLPGIVITNWDDLKKNITIENLLMMESGLDYPEWTTNNPYRSLIRSRNWVEFILNKPMVCNPGEYWNYSSGNSHLLSAILNKVCKTNELAFADQNLFRPLGISKYVWYSDPQGNLGGGFDLSMRPADMAKFGYLYLKKGKWKARQIVSEDWVNQSTQLHYDFPDSLKIYSAAKGYGYQWWILDTEGYGASGHLGQRILVYPTQDMVIVFTGSLDNKDLAMPVNMARDMILQSVKSDSALPEKSAAYSSHLKLLKEVESKPQKGHIYQMKDTN